MESAGGDVVLLQADGPRVRFREEVRVRDYKALLEGGDSLGYCLERSERLKGGSVSCYFPRPRRKCALLLLDDSPCFSPLSGSEDEDEEVASLRRFLDNSPVDQDLLGFPTVHSQ
jgi:hypothetical protein